MNPELNFEKELREALAPVQPPAGLASRIVAAAARRERRRWMQWAAMAAMLTLVTFWGVRWQKERQAQQEAARQAAEQFSLAMNIATRKVSQIQERLVIEVKLPPRREWKVDTQ